LLGRLRARDPNWFGLRRAARAAVVVPAVFAIGSQVIGDAQVATFAAFGSFALLLFVNFAGGPAARAGGYLGLALAGAVLIAVGTELATPDWLAVAAMGVIAFCVLFAGVISSMISGATQAALLASILAVMLPGSRSDLPERLAGWGIAAAVAIPVALFVWPPRDRDELRLRAAQLCRRLADLLALVQPAPGAGDTLVAMRSSARELRAAFRTSATRTAGLSTGARLTIRLVGELEWLAAAVVNACVDAPDRWPEQGRRLREAAAQALTACGAALDHRGSGPDERCRLELDERLAALDAARRAVVAESLAELKAGSSVPDGQRPRGEFDRPLYAAHELGFAVALVGDTVAAISAADARSWWERLIGRRVTEDELGVVAVAKHSALGQLDRHAVWLHNSVRGAAGLASAVLLARVVDAQNSFWIGLGALSVLRSNALSTGATALRALVGTGVGFAIGAALVSVLGTSHALLWPLLPVLILVAASAPSTISFVAGQAAFTVLIIVLFNIIAPVGWRIGVVRIEDVALGCVASLGAGVLFWPRGAAAALGGALAEAYRAAAGYLQQAVEHVTGRRVEPPDGGQAAMAAGERLDEALRQYLAERGTKRVPLESVAALANGATRLRLAGAAIKRLQFERSDGLPPVAVDGVLDRPATVLSRRAAEVTGWYEALGTAFARSGNPLPSDGHVAGADSFLEVVLPAVEACDDGQRAQAERLLWSGQYLGDVDRLRSDLLEPAGQVAAARARPWWGR
jgi:uncharacterized membrane protein YccC